MTISLRFVSPNWHWEVFSKGNWAFGMSRSLHDAWRAVDAAVEIPKDNTPGYVEPPEFWR